MGSSEAFRVEVLTDIAAAAPRWEALQAAGAATPFQSHAWVSAMARTLGRAAGADTFAIVGSEAATGRDVLLLPLVRRKLGPLDLVESPDFGLSDYCGPILARDMMTTPERLAPLWRAALRALPAVDLLRLGKVPARLEGLPHPLLGLHGGLKPLPLRSWAALLPDDWAAYEAEALSPKFRSNMRRSLRLLAGSGRVEHAVARSPAEVERFYAALLAQRSARFSRIARPDPLASADCAAFYRLVLLEGLSTGLASIAALTVDGAIVATLLGLHWRDAYLALVPTMSEAVPKGHAPGKVIYWLQMRHLHAAGCRTFDFTIGDEPYKRDYGAEPGRLYGMARPLRLRGMPAALGIQARARIRRWRDDRTPIGGPADAPSD